MAILLTSRRVLLASGLAASLMSGWVFTSAASAAETLKVVLASNVGVLDPIATTSYATRTFGYLVFDTLIARDAEGKYRPQMLEKWDVSDDGNVYTFVLREGLVFSDGTTVTAEDAVASIKRWWQVDPFGKRLAGATGDLSVKDEKTFVLTLSRPFGHVIEALGKPSSNIPVIMPARIAANTPAKEPVKEIVGSGPFVFDASTWNPGSSLIVKRNDKYVPRDEEPSGMAGGKKVYVDQVEILNVPDPATQASALQIGEIDFIEMSPHDFVQILEADPNVTVQHFQGVDQTMGATVINHLNPPFNNIKVRRALQALAIPREYMTGLGLSDEQWTHDCSSMFMCDSTYGNDGGKELIPEASVENAKKLLAESGYNGELVRILHASTTNDINQMGLILFGLMQQAGFNVELASSDWPTVANARWNKEPVQKGGWSLTQVTWGGEDLSSPFTNYTIANNCTDGYSGWACDERITALNAEFEKETDMEKRKEIVRKIQTAATENVQFLVQGQYSRSQSYRSDLEGFQNQNNPVFWGVKRKKQ